MKNLSDYHQEHLNDQKLGIVDNNGQVQKECQIENGIPIPIDAQKVETRAKVFRAMEKATNIVHINFGGAQVEDLEGEAAGQQNMLQKPVSSGMKIDTDFLINATSQEITHVLVHEAGHLQNTQKNNGVRVSDLEWEEALTELGAAKKTNEVPIAYLDYIQRVKGKIAQSSATETELVEAYTQGNSARINEVIAETEDKNIAA